ncbi:glycosyltransferase family 2 protein [Acidiphilium acidophilum]|uniref:glycosyltransferase family 2 protein n=1 Tax=Acidiphilium acidophilum TaxID=76588 RepID=UPI002E8E6B38|nr:glycosyltransferase family 2 protein [Acidiphilium acidophilum]
MMRVSVVLPCFNRAMLIVDALDRVLDQTRPADEVIVVDDGSTDRTLEALARYKDRVSVVVISNSGDLVARNIGLRAASGDLVAFCDSDDLWQPTHLEEMVKFWTGVASPICAYADFQEVRCGIWSNMTKFEMAPLGYWDRLVPVHADGWVFPDSIIADLLRFQPFFPSCMVVDRARFLALGGWDEGVSRLVGCDCATTLRVAEHPPIGVLRQPTVGIRKHAGNFSGDVLRMNLGDADVLAHVLASRPTLARYAREIEASIVERRQAGFDTAFATGDFAAVRRVAGLLDGKLGPARRIKNRVAHLPEPIRRGVWRGLTRLGSRFSA